jgi:hypothetical protein
VSKNGKVPQFDSGMSDEVNANAVRMELDRGDRDHEDFVNFHQGLAVVMEEFEELKEEVFKKELSAYRIKSEAAQVAAMGLKMMRLADKFLHSQRYLTTEEGRKNVKTIIG